MEDLWRDLRYALRSLGRTKLVTLVATLSLALAIAGNATVFSLISSLFLRPLPYEEPERIILVGERPRDLPDGAGITGASVANFLDWRERQTCFEHLAAFQPRPAGLASGEAEPEAVLIGTATTGFFELLGVQPARGRLFTAEDSGTGALRIALVTHGFWTERLGRAWGDSAVVTIDQQDYRVVGILPADFEFLFGAYDLWIPRPLDPVLANRQFRQLIIFGRLAPGRTQEQAEAEMTAIYTDLTETYPQENRGYEIGFVNLRHDIPGGANELLFGIMQGALFFVLLIACANLANLLLARGQTREREVAIRMGLGAGRGRIARLLLTESGVLAVLSGGLGLLGAWSGVRILQRVLVNAVPGAWMPALDLSVIVFTVSITLFALLLLGLVPVLQSRGFRLAATLRDGLPTMSAGGRRRRLSCVLVIAEVTLSLVLLGGTAVLIRGFLALQNSDPGFETTELLSFDLRLPDRYQEEEFVVTFERVRAALDAVPGVRSATMANIRPRTPFTAQQVVAVDGQAPDGDGTLPRVGRVNVDEAFLATLGIPLLAGRGIESTDRVGTAPVVVVNEALGRRFWGEVSPLGHRLTIDGVSHKVVGLVTTVRHGLAINEEFAPTLYLPMAQNPDRNQAVTMKTEVPPATLYDVVRRAVLEIDPTLTIRQLQPLEEFLGQFYVGQNMVIGIMGGFGILALLLAALGTYGVLAYWVVQRRHEIGIRMALGAGRGQVVGMVSGQGLLMAVVGILVGIPGVVVLTRAISAQVAVVMPVDPLAVVAVGVLLLVVVLAASLLPAWRAASVHPIRALRPE